MLLKPTILLLLVGAVLANHQNGWKNGKQYTYKIRSRTLTSLSQQSKQYTGILIKAKLTVQPNGEDTLRARVEQPRYAQIHTKLDDFDSEIPADQLNFQSLPLSNEPIEIKIKNGVVQDLVVNKNVPTWEVNILKSIVSQLQVDTQGENAIPSLQNHLPEGKEPNAMFKAMEDSVSGKCEVLYDISPLPEHVVQNQPELVPLPELREDGDLINVVKSKNFSNCKQRVSYHFGLDGRNNWEPGTNANGKDFSRSAVSRVVLSGNLKKYTIQSSVTTSKFIHDSNHQQHKQGMIASRMNLTLHEVKDIPEPMQVPSNPQSTGNLVYNYNNPFESSSSRRPSRIDDSKNHKDRNQRHGDKTNSDESGSNESDESDSVYDNDNNNYLQPMPKLQDAPQNPLSSLFIGNKGNSIQKNNDVDVVKAVKNIAQQVGNEMQQPDSMPQERTLEKFTILTNLLRTMSADKIAEVQRDLFEPAPSSNQLNAGNQAKNARRNAWVVLRDAVAQAGTGPALVNIKKWIQNKQIKQDEAVHVVQMTSKSALTPTPEYMDAYFEMATMPETKEQRQVQEAAILSLADLIRSAIVDKHSAHNRYPVHSFGRMFSKNNRNLQEKYMPYLINELEKAVNNGDSKKIQVLITALGKTGHHRMLSVFEPYLEGRKQISPFQRLVMVLSLDKLSQINPKNARSVLYKIYANNAEHPEIRTAAVYMLMATNPPASMLQRMADNTNHDSNKHVNSAVKSTIESLAQLQGEENRELAENARAAMPLLTRENYGAQFSRNMYVNVWNPMTDSENSLQAAIISGGDTIIPKGVYINRQETVKGIKIPKIEIAGAVSSMKGMIDFVVRKVADSPSSNGKNNQKVQESRYSPENLARLLGIHGDNPEQVEGFVLMNGLLGNHYLSFDNHTLEKIPQKLRELAEEMKGGKSFEETRLSNFEIKISFPTETGLPSYFSYRIPTVMSVNGESSLRTESDSSNQNKLPKSATLSGKVKIIFATEFQKRMGFITPFEHQEYVAGIDSNIQVHLPIRGEVEINSNEHEARVKLQAHGEQKQIKMLQYEVQPFTSKHDILNTEPIKKDSNTHIINKDRAIKSQVDLNDQNNKQGVQLSWETVSKRSEEDSNSGKNKMQNAMEALSKLTKSITSQHPAGSSGEEYQKYALKVSPNSDMNVEIRVSCDSSTSPSNNNGEDSDDWSPKAKAPHLDKNMNEQERKQKLLNEASKNINSAKARAINVNVRLNGGIQSSVDITAALGTSDVDPKSRALLYASGNVMNGEDYHLAAALETKDPHVKTLDYEETLKANKPREFDAVIHYGKGNDHTTEQNKHELRIKGNLKLTDDRKNVILQSRDAKTCSKETMERGNKLAPECEVVNKRAADINAGEVVITFDNEPLLEQMSLNGVDTLILMSRNYAQSRTDRKDSEQDNKIKISFKMSPDNQNLDLVMKSRNGKVEFKDIKVNEDNEEQRNNPKSKNNINSESNALNNRACNLDKTWVDTFDDRHYQVRLGQCWHVAMTTFPKNDPDAPGAQLPIQENMHVSVLAKENDDGDKQLKVTLGEKEVELSSKGPKHIKVKVNGQEVQDLSKHQGHQEKSEGQVALEIVKLPDDSVKIVSDKFDVRVIYDGVRAKIQVGQKYRDSVRGLCGNDDGESWNDQKTPKGHMLQKPEEFAATFALTNDEECRGPAVENAKKAENSPKIFETIRPGNVISEQEAGRGVSPRQNSGRSDSGEDRCTQHRTKVIRSEDEICFSLRPVPNCSSRCEATSTKAKSIAFHCVPRTSASEKVAQRVEKGANPDLSQKKVSRNEVQQIPVSCRA